MASWPARCGASCAHARHRAGWHRRLTPSRARAQKLVEFAEGRGLGDAGAARAIGGEPGGWELGGCCYAAWQRAAPTCQAATRPPAGEADLDFGKFAAAFRKLGVVRRRAAAVHWRRPAPGGAAPPGTNATWPPPPDHQPPYLSCPPGRGGGRGQRRRLGRPGRHQRPRALQVHAQGGGRAGREHQDHPRRHLPLGHPHRARRVGPRQVPARPWVRERRLHDAQLIGTGAPPRPPRSVPPAACCIRLLLTNSA
jgi:hypothetical protein